MVNELKNVQRKNIWLNVWFFVRHDLLCGLVVSIFFGSLAKSFPHAWLAYTIFSKNYAGSSRFLVVLLLFDVGHLTHILQGYVTETTASIQMKQHIISLPNIFYESTMIIRVPDSNVHGANMRPIWVLSAPDGPHVGPMNLAIRGNHDRTKRGKAVCPPCTQYLIMLESTSSFWWRLQRQRLMGIWRLWRIEWVMILLSRIFQIWLSIDKRF